MADDGVADDGVADDGVADDGVADDGVAESARRALEHVAARSSGPRVDGSLRITLNFHPDRGDPPILAALAAHVYRSQFVTGTSNGGLTARRSATRTAFWNPNTSASPRPWT